MKNPLLPALFVALLALPFSAFAVDPASLPDIKKTKLGLYIEAREVPDFLKNHPKALFLDLRTPEELLAFLFILFCNLIGLLPGFLSPTSNINTTLAFALCTFVYTHYLGVKFHGVKYIEHFLGPIPWLAPLFFPIEIIGHCARVLSLTLRLFGTIMGEDLVLLILIFLAGQFLAPLPMMFLAIFTSLVQAFIFTLLSMMYFAGSMEHAH